MPDNADDLFGLKPPRFRDQAAFEEWLNSPPTRFEVFSYVTELSVAASHLMHAAVFLAGPEPARAADHLSQGTQSLEAIQKYLVKAVGRPDIG